MQLGVWWSTEKRNQKRVSQGLWKAGGLCGATGRWDRACGQEASQGTEAYVHTCDRSESPKGSRRGCASWRKNPPRPRVHLCVWEREVEIVRVSSIITGCLFLPGLLSSVFLLTIKDIFNRFVCFGENGSSQTVSDGLLSLKSNNIFNLSLFLIFPPLCSYMCVIMNEWMMDTYII